MELVTVVTNSAVVHGTLVKIDLLASVGLGIGRFLPRDAAFVRLASAFMSVAPQASSPPLGSPQAPVPTSHG